MQLCETGEKELPCAVLRREHFEWHERRRVVEKILALEVEIRRRGGVKFSFDKLSEDERAEREPIPCLVHNEYGVGAKTCESERQEAVAAGRSERLTLPEVGVKHQRSLSSSEAERAYVAKWSATVSSSLPTGT